MFELNSNPKISRLEIVDDECCLVIDDFLIDPRGAVEYAGTYAEKFELEEHGYPGMLMNVDDGELADVYGFIRKTLSREMRFFRGGIKPSTFFSIVTLPPEELNWAQRVCHTDP